ncbi:MAG: SPASM domain-containing protein [Syntrophobacterales bacterium]|nr:MAG: SPASM domain-containing protein [Syntrophobacterales bacterium]
MRGSKFNIFIPSFPDEGEFLVFNTFTDSRVVINEELKKAMEKADGNAPLKRNEVDYLNQLKELGIMVDDEVDEDRELQYWYQKFRYDPSTLSITILTTYACNLRCIYCFQEGLHSPSSMDRGISGKVIRWTSGKLHTLFPRTLELIFYGGEPLLNPKAIRIISQEMSEVTKPMGIALKISIITNGVLVDGELVDFLLPLGLKEIKVTLDGDREAHDLKRPHQNGDGTFETIFKNLLQLKGKVPISIGGNFDDSNKESIPRLLDLLEEHGFNGHLKRVGFKPIFSSLDAANVPRNSLSTCTFSDINVDDMLWLRRETEKRGFPSQTGIALGPCGAAGENTYTIDPFGKIYKCPGSAGMDQFVIGDINEEEFNYRNTQFMTFDPCKICRGCPYIPLCGGGCRMGAYIKKGDFLDIACERKYFDKTAPEIVKYEYLAG